MIFRDVGAAEAYLRVCQGGGVACIILDAKSNSDVG